MHEVHVRSVLLVVELVRARVRQNQRATLLDQGRPAIHVKEITLRQYLHEQRIQKGVHIVRANIGNGRDEHVGLATDRDAVLLEAALEHLTRAAQLKPVYRNAPAREAAVLEQLGRDELAVNAWRRALEAGVAGGRDDDERQALHARDLARTWMRLGRPDQAIAPYEQAVARLPRAWRVRVELAGAYAAVHRDREAQQELQRVLQARPRDFEAIVTLAQLRLDSEDTSVRDPAEARRLARQAASAAGGDPQRRVRAEMLRQRARDVVRSEKTRGADAPAREAGSDPDDSGAR